MRKRGDLFIKENGVWKWGDDEGSEEGRQVMILNADKKAEKGSGVGVGERDLLLPSPTPPS